MKRIDLSNYGVEISGPEGSHVEPYDMRTSARLVLLNPQAQLNAVELLANDDLAQKIGSTEGDELLLEDAEYAQLVSALDTVRGLRANDVQFVRRIKNAEDVDVEVKEDAGS